MQTKLFIRYLLVGGLNTVFGYTVFALLVYLGLHYSIALFFATVAGIFFNFKTIGHFVFARSEWKFLWKFIMIYGVLYIVNVCCIFVLLYYVNNVYLANALALIIIAGLGFFLNRSFVYANN